MKMAFYTVLSKSKDGEHFRSLTVEAETKAAAEKAAQTQNEAIADQEQSEAYTVSETTKD
jgi:hypothetical protein